MEPRLPELNKVRAICERLRFVRLIFLALSLLTSIEWTPAKLRAAEDQQMWPATYAIGAAKASRRAMKMLLDGWIPSQVVVDNMAAVPVKIYAFLPHLRTYKHLGQQGRIEAVEDAVAGHRPAPGAKLQALRVAAAAPTPIFSIRSPAETAGLVATCPSPTPMGCAGTADLPL
jgi:hypothetical protein